MMDQMTYDSATGECSAPPVREAFYNLGREFGLMGRRAFIRDAFPNLHPSEVGQHELTFVTGRDAGMMEWAERAGRAARAAGEACVVPGGLKGRLGVAWLRGYEGLTGEGGES